MFDLRMKPIDVLNSGARWRSKRRNSETTVKPDGSNLKAVRA
jgi:hypothetical protein